METFLLTIEAFQFDPKNVELVSITDVEPYILAGA